MVIVSPMGQTNEIYFAFELSIRGCGGLLLIVMMMGLLFGLIGRRGCVVVLSTVVLMIRVAEFGSQRVLLFILAADLKRLRLG